MKLVLLLEVLKLLYCAGIGCPADLLLNRDGLKLMLLLRVDVNAGGC